MCETLFFKIESREKILDLDLNVHFSVLNSQEFSVPSDVRRDLYYICPTGKPAFPFQELQKTSHHTQMVHTHMTCLTHSKL